ncbi:MAG: PEP/pyruvate-binding domain-containing protein [Acidobacteriaceae bacterium]
MAAVRWLSDTDLRERQSVGGKGASLGDLVHLGMPVPAGFIVTTSVYAGEAERCRLSDALSPLLAMQHWAAAERLAKKIILSLPIGPELNTVLTAYRNMGSPTVAVRSSATAEDLETASFAGQHDSFLNIHGEEALLQAIRNCWASLWSERALRYRHERSVDHLSVRMAILVQEMVQSEVAGVVFTVDPLSRRSDCMHVEAAVGLGENVVSGTTRTQIYLVSRRTLVPYEPVNSGALSAPRLSELCRTALQIERHMGCPQDVEFAFASGKLFILQARAITTIKDVAEPEPLPHLGAASPTDKLMRPIAAERYAMAPRPFDNIVFIRVVGAVMYAIRRLGGSISAEDEAAFRAQIWRQAYRLPSVHLTARFLIVQWKYLSLLKGDWLAWWADGPRKELQAVSEVSNLAALSDEQLFEGSDEVLAVWEKALNERFYVSSAMNARPWLDRIVGLVANREERSQIVADLMSGLHTPTSEINEALWYLSRLARQDALIRTALRDLRPEAIPTTPSGNVFRNEFNAFLVNYGHREGAGYYVSTPTWEHDPIQVLRIVSSLAEVEARADSSVSVRQRYESARKLVDHRLRFLPGIRELFGWLVERLRALDIFRETSHFDITRPLAVLQEVAAELSRRLRARGLLHKEDDLFYLTYDEVRTWCAVKAPHESDVNKLIEQRRATYEVANARWQAERSSSIESKTGDLLKGVPASRGVATGRARIIRDEREFHLLRPGEVLVCPYSNPAWTPLFISAAAVISETGGAASHAAIVAREYGIPAVMSVSGATQALQNAPDIVVDGERGIVQILHDRP